MAPHSKWTREAIDALICAYRREPSLYSVKSSNYYNRRLRAETLARVANYVCLFRANTTSKECYSKMHGLRNQFNVEHAKVKSKSSRTVLNDVYIPSLWYYEKLKFLAEEIVPRSSKKRKNFDLDLHQQSSAVSNYASEVVCSQSFSQNSETQQSPQISVEDCYSLDLKVLNPVCFMEQAADQQQQQQQPPSQETPSRGKSQTRSGEGNTAAVEASARETCAPHARHAGESTIDNCMNFIGSLAKEIESEEIRIQLMSDLVKASMQAKMKDLENR